MLDINKVCKQYGITSRTLRFYEEKGLIKGQKSPDSGRRQYSEDDLRMLQGILTLRAIGLPIKEIKECLKDGKSLIEILRYREKELEAAIRGKMEEILMLQKALAAVEEGKDVFAPILKLDDAEAEPWERVNPETLHKTPQRAWQASWIHMYSIIKRRRRPVRNISYRKNMKSSAISLAPKCKPIFPRKSLKPAGETLLQALEPFDAMGKPGKIHPMTM